MLYVRESYVTIKRVAVYSIVLGILNFYLLNSTLNSDANHTGGVA
jgi:hypothetical protein